MTVSLFIDDSDTSHITYSSGFQSPWSPGYVPNDAADPAFNGTVSITTDVNPQMAVGFDSPTFAAYTGESLPLVHL